MKPTLQNATLAAKSGTPTLRARYQEFDLDESPRFQNQGDAPPKFLGFALATLRIVFHFGRETHPDPTDIRTTLRTLAGEVAQITLDSGLRFIGNIQFLAWREKCDDDGRFVTAAAELILTGKEVANVTRQLS